MKKYMLLILMACAGLANAVGSISDFNKERAKVDRACLRINHAHENATLIKNFLHPDFVTNLDDLRDICRGRKSLIRPFARNQFILREWDRNKQDIKPLSRMRIRPLYSDFNFDSLQTDCAANDKLQVCHTVEKINNNVKHIERIMRPSTNLILQNFQYKCLSPSYNTWLYRQNIKEYPNLYDMRTLENLARIEYIARKQKAEK